MARKESRLRRQLKLEGSLIERVQPRHRLSATKRRTA
jgi:hypothetical protein